jgi:signal transduction histidine kinase
MIRMLKTHQLIIDVLVGAAFAFAAVQFTTGRIADYALIGAMAVALILRRLSPGASLVVAWGSALFQMYLANLGPTVADLAILAVLFSTAAYGGRALKWIGLSSVGLGAILGSTFIAMSGRGILFGLNFALPRVAELAVVVLQVSFLLVAMLVLLGLPWTLGLLVRTRITASESRAAQLTAELEAQRAEAGVIVEQEKNRIARDMHDVVAHSLAVVIAQADGARYVRTTDPAAVDDALATISSTAREALADVRLLLGQLRHNQAEGPQPALADLGRLLDQLRGSGLTIRYEEVGVPLALGTGQQLAVYRIVQEGLTNVLRHGDVSREAVVHFEWTPVALELTVTSAIASSPNTGELRVGHGVAGMRERATLAAGWLTAAQEGKSFVVRASVPALAVVGS